MIIHRLGLLALACLVMPATAQVLWKEPPPATHADWVWGPGGQVLEPRPPFQFVKEKPAGTNPKIEVRDAAGRTWIVKFGAEVHADTFAPRLLHAVGYATTPTYFVASGSIAGIQGLKRSKHFISKSGEFRSARFKLHTPEGRGGDRAWSWAENPFLGSHELGGLKILMMITSNWDAKDSRDGEGESNNGRIPPDWYAVTDWGASFGKTGGYFSRARWDWVSYRLQDATFVRLTPAGALAWGFKGKHGQDITSGVQVEDVRWLLTYLSRVTDEDLSAGLSASGASAPVAREFTLCIRERIGQLKRVADSSAEKQASR
jgi:hypothetical protein